MTEDIGIILFVILAVFVCATFVIWLDQHNNNDNKPDIPVQQNSKNVPTLNPIIIKSI